VLAGQLGGALGSKFAKSKAISSPAHKDLGTEAERATRMASPTKANGTRRRIGRPATRQRKAAKANVAKRNFVEGAAERGGIVGAGGAGGAGGLIEARKAASDQNQENK